MPDRTSSGHRAKRLGRGMTSRRTFLRQSSLAGLAGVTGVVNLPGAAGGARQRSTPRASSFVDVRRPPDTVAVETADGCEALSRIGDEWRGGRAMVRTDVTSEALRVRLSAQAPL